MAELSDEQVFALNRSLNNAINNPFGANFDSEHLQLIVDGDYNKLQINSLSKALESEAKFLALAEKTGNDKFLDKAEREKEKFMAMVDRFDGHVSGKDSAAAAAKSAAKSAAKKAAAGAARKAAKNAAKSAAKAAAKDAVKQAVKNQAKNAGKGKKS